MKKVVFIASLIILTSPLSGSAQVIAPSCPAQQPGQSGAFTIPENWKTKFPFDLVYPSSNPDTDNEEDYCFCLFFEFIILGGSVSGNCLSK